MARERLTEAHRGHLYQVAQRSGVPAWLAKHFQPTGRSLTVAGRELKLYVRAMAQDGSLTFGSNSEGGVAAAMYLVFVNAAP